MRYVYFLFIIALGFTLTSCERKEISGSGKLSQETRALSEFNRINFNGSGNLFIIQSDQESVKIEAESNIIPLIKTQVNDEDLHINFDNVSFKPTMPINIYVKVKNVQLIRLYGSGTITGKDLDVDVLKVSLSGSGNVDLNLKGNKLISVLAGSGSFVVQGSISDQQIWISGAGTYHGFELSSNHSLVNISGSGQVFLDVKEQLDAQISGSGTITYKGDPKITQKISGSGKIIKTK